MDQTPALLDPLIERKTSEEFPQDLVSFKTHLHGLDQSLPADFPFPGLMRAVDRHGGEPDFNSILRIISQCAANGTVKHVPILGQPGIVSFTASQASCILANSFFSNVKSFPGCGSLSWMNLFCTLEPVGAERLLCLFDYFERAGDFSDRPSIEFERTSFESWNWDDATVLQGTNVKMHLERMEEHSQNQAFVDFANKKLQIHRLIPSCTQEEVLFSVASECLLSLLFIPILEASDAVVIRHVWRHCDYDGYLDSFTFKCPLEELWLEEVVAIDACTSNHFAQSVRDLKKCYAGFASVQSEIISTGKWGCGVFAGDTAHKFLQQLMCAQLCGKSLAYSSYRNQEELDRFQALLELIRERKPTYGWLLSAMTKRPKGGSFYENICNEMKKL